MMAVGCELSGVRYINGQAFQPTPLYKCLCVSGAIGCTPVFIPKSAPNRCAVLKGERKSGRSKCVLGEQKKQQSTGYRLMPGVQSLSDHLFHAYVSSFGSILYDLKKSN